MQLIYADIFIGKVPQWPEVLLLGKPRWALVFKSLCRSEPTSCLNYTGIHKLDILPLISTEDPI